MDLGIAGKRAIVCGASRGLGFGCAQMLVREGVDVVIAARGADAIAAAVDRLNGYRAGKATGVAADVTTEAGRAAVLEACADPDILINNAGGPPPGDFRTWGRAEWIAALDANMLSAIELIKATIDPMIKRKFGRIVNITSHMVKEPTAMLGLSNGARAGLTGFVGGLARDVARHGVTVNNLLPGQFDTDRLRSNHQRFASRTGADPEQFRERMRNDVPAKRFGTAEEFGATCAFLCSAHAGYITGQNVLMDGGQYRGLM
jgi:3-oxoacyl-[acyl-carrier protein] reductase